MKNDLHNSVKNELHDSVKNDLHDSVKNDLHDSVKNYDIVIINGLILPLYPVLCCKKNYDKRKTDYFSHASTNYIENDKSHRKSTRKPLLDIQISNQIINKALSLLQIYLFRKLNGFEL